MADSRDPRPLPGIEAHIAGDSARKPARGISTATAAATPLLHYRTAPAYQAFRLLRLAFVLWPLLEGADKLLRLLTRWERFVAPLLTRKLGVDPTLFLQIVGGLEIALGLLVWRRTRVGAYVLALWFFAQAIQLCLLPGLYDVALRRLLLALAALALARMAEEFRLGFGAVSDWER